ncbi:MAG: EamA family transporter [Deltaproteobacteria bacterium]|nr:EamA family transporter [Deltaproteobacteria bacterium]
MAIPAQVIALCASLSYACVLVSSRRGMQYSTPKTVTLISLIVHTVSLWTAVFFTGGIPSVDTVAVYVFIVAGMLQPIIRLCTYTGVHRVGASRSSPIRSTHPMFGVFVAITVLGENGTVLVLAGVVSVVCGIVLITWKPAAEVRSFRWWEFLFPLTAALLAGIVHPMRRFALAISHEPLFFAALVGIVSLACFLVYMPFSREPLVWDRRAMLPFIAAGTAETCGILLVITALGVGSVITVSPLVGISPLWVLLGTVIFLRDLEQVSLRTAVGAICVIAGTAAISLGG